MGTQTESADTISGALEAAFTEAENTQNNQNTQESTPEAADKTTAQTIQELIEAPAHWPEDIKGRFGELGKLQGGNEWQKWLLDRHKSMEGDYTKKTQAFADFRKTYEPVHSLFEPYLPQLQQAGMGPADLIQRYFEADKRLQENPTDALKWLAEQYGVDLSQLTKQQQADPAYTKLQQELDELRRSVQTREQQEAQTRLNATLNEINTFAEEKDETGNPKRPYFGEVVNDMMALAQALRATGQTPKLQDLYDRAVWANPEVRQKLIAAEKQAQAKLEADEAAKKSARAKKASASVSGSPGASAPRTDRTLREELEAQLGV